MNVAIWAAVSTETQAAGDKVSIPVQIEACRRLAAARGWTETAGPYIVPGASRTRYVNLRDAEARIPALREMLNDAQNGRFQILLLYDYNRLRDLADPVARALAAYGVQLYSINQPVEPTTMEEADTADGESIMRGISGIISRWQINDLRRKYRYGVAARVQRGLYALKIPYGYTTPNKDIPPVPEPSRAALLVRLKDLYLHGSTLEEVRQAADDSGLKPARGGKWDRSIISDILRNPFYAGFVTFRRTRLVTDPRNDRRYQENNPDPLIYPGKHQALWSETEHHRILAEFERRGPGYRSKYPFTGLMVCAECNAPIWVQLGEPRKDGTLVVSWRCITPANPRHVRLPTETVARLVATALRSSLLQNGPEANFQPGENKLPNVDLQTSTLRRQRARIEAAYEAELYTLEQFKEKTEKIDAALKNLIDEEQQKRRQQEQAHQRQEIQQTLIQYEHLDEWLLTDDPQTVKIALRLLCKRILLSPTSAIIEYR